MKFSETKTYLYLRTIGSILMKEDAYCAKIKLNYIRSDDQKVDFIHSLAKINKEIDDPFARNIYTYNWCIYDRCTLEVDLRLYSAYHASEFDTKVYKATIDSSDVWVKDLNGCLGLKL